MRSEYGLTKAQRWLREIGQELSFAAWFTVHAIVRCILVTIIIIGLGLAMNVPARSVRADGPQTLGDAVRYYVPDNAWVLSTWQYSPYGQPYSGWINDACTYAGVCGADGQAPTIMRSSRWAMVWWQQAQQQVQQPAIPIQTQIPKTPPRQDFVPGWRAYVGAAWEVAKGAAAAGESSIFGFIANTNALYRAYGPTYGVHGNVNN